MLEPVKTIHGRFIVDGENTGFGKWQVDWSKRPPWMEFVFEQPRCPYCRGELKLANEGEHGVDEAKCVECQTIVLVCSDGSMKEWSD